MYKRRFRQWKLAKNLTARQVEGLHWELAIRKANDEGSKVIKDGKVITEDELQRYEKRVKWRQKGRVGNNETGGQACEHKTLRTVW